MPSMVIALRDDSAIFGCESVGAAVSNRSAKASPQVHRSAFAARCFGFAQIGAAERAIDFLT